MADVIFLQILSMLLFQERFLFSIIMFKFESETGCTRDLDPMSINSVLAKFRLSLFAFNHILRFSKSEFTAFSSSLIVPPEAVRFVSSAKSLGFVLFRHSDKSFMYIRKIKGLKWSLEEHHI